MSTAMFSTMHKSANRKANGWSISRYKFFIFVWAGAFLWYFVPGLLMPALSYFNVITWFAPKSVVISNLVCLCFVSLSSVWVSIPSCRGMLLAAKYLLNDLVWRGIGSWNVPLDI